MIQLKVITPLGLYLEEEIESINLKTVDGYRTILSNHIPLVAMLATCRCIIKTKEGAHTYALANGLLQIHDNEMRILSDAIEGKEDIDLERAKRAKERAEKRLQKKDEDMDIKRVEVALAKAINRINIYEEH